MKNRISIALFVLFAILIAILTFAPNRSLAQETSESGRKLVSKVVPLYPSIARSMRIQGIVRAEVLVAPNGKVTSIEVKGGHPLLAQAAQEALRQWKWEATSHETHETVELRFNP